MNRFILMGTTDEVTTCDCCGRKNLKNTVCFEDTETGNLTYFGVVCASKMRGVKADVVKAEIKNAVVEYTKAALLYVEKHPRRIEFLRLMRANNEVRRDFDRPVEEFMNHPARVAFREIQQEFQAELDAKFPRKWRESIFNATMLW